MPKISPKQVLNQQRLESYASQTTAIISQKIDFDSHEMETFYFSEDGWEYYLRVDWLMPGVRSSYEICIKRASAIIDGHTSSTGRRIFEGAYVYKEGYKEGDDDGHKKDGFAFFDYTYFDRKQIKERVQTNSVTTWQYSSQPYFLNKQI